MKNQENIRLVGNLADIAVNAGKMYAGLGKTTMDSMLTLGMQVDAEDTRRDFSSLRKTKLGIVGSCAGVLAYLATIGTLAYGIVDTLGQMDGPSEPRSKIEIYDGHSQPVVTIYNPSPENIKWAQERNQPTITNTNSPVELEAK